MFALLFFAAPVVSPPQKVEPDYYVCEVEPKSGTFGKIFYRMDVPVDGRQPFHRIQWHIPERPEGLKLYVQWDEWGPFRNEFDDLSWVHVTFRTHRRIRDEVRIEIRRMDGQRYPAEFAYAGQFQKPFLWSGKPPHYYIDTQARWGELKAWMEGRKSLTFALVRRDGTVLAEDRLDSTTLDASSTAISAMRPEAEAIAADYRHKCSLPEPITVD